MNLTTNDSVIIPASVAVMLGLDAQAYPALLCTNAFGARVTAIGFETDYLDLLDSAAPDVVAGVSIPIDKFPMWFWGWPKDWLDTSPQPVEGHFEPRAIPTAENLRAAIAMFDRGDVDPGPGPGQRERFADALRRIEEAEGHPGG